MHPSFQRPPLPFHPRPSLCTPRCTLPSRPAAVARDVRSALQLALQARCSRLSISLPPTLKLAVEKRATAESDDIARAASDREVARLVAGMFEGTGLNVRVAFEDARGVKWVGAECDVVQWGKKKQKKGGFGGRGDGVSDVDVLICVGRGRRFVERGREEAANAGMDRLVIWINGVDDGEVVYWAEERGDVMVFRRFPEDWIVYQVMGMANRVLMKSELKPSDDDVSNAVKEAESSSVLDKLGSFKLRF